MCSLMPITYLYNNKVVGAHHFCSHRTKTADLTETAERCLIGKSMYLLCKREFLHNHEGQ